MPESVTDRCTKSHEYIFMLSKSKKYYYDQDAIREPHSRDWTGCGGNIAGSGEHKRNDGYSDPKDTHPKACVPNLQGRNKRTVWTVTTKPFKGAHFAVFPPDLIRPCVLAGCPPDGTVLDPFFGAGTTGLVAKQEGRGYIGIELNPEYAEMARERIKRECPMERLI